MIRVKDTYMRDNLRERSKGMFLQYLFFSLCALVAFFTLGRLVIEPLLIGANSEAEAEDKFEEGATCPLGKITNTTCNDRGFCEEGLTTCECSDFGLYEGETCQTIAPAFIVGISFLSLYFVFMFNILILISLGDGGAPWWFNKDGANKALKAEHIVTLRKSKRKRG